MTPKRIQRKRTKGWRMPPNTVSVTRHGKWGNPFVVGEVVRMKRCGPGGYEEIFVADAEHAVRLFKLYAARWHATMIQSYQELRGKNLACFCPLDQPCHADVLLELANRETVER